MISTVMTYNNMGEYNSWIILYIIYNNTDNIILKKEAGHKNTQQMLTLT